MTNRVVTEIIGLQYGDEGKGKVSCYETADAKLVIRSTGGNNAGHTVVFNGRKFALHLIPSGVVRQDAISILAPGMVIDPSVLIDEMRKLQDRGIKLTPQNLMISDRAHVIMPYHKYMDEYKETLKKHPVGTTKSGIGPAYASKADRIGLRMFDIVSGNYEGMIREELNTFPKGLFDMIFFENSMLEKEGYIHTILQQCEYYKEMLAPYVCNTQKVVNEAILGNKKIVLEGAQAYSLDIDHGDYPFVTSSNPNASGTASAVCIGPRSIDSVIGVIKAYTSRVGEGPFVTEQKNEVGDNIRELGHEFGTTTGRPRRCGWLDLVQVRDAVIANSVTCLAVNHVDTIGKLPEIKVCVAYCYKGQEVDYYVPIDKENVTPIYKTFKGGWTISENCKSRCDLPKGARDYLQFIEQFTGVPVSFIGIGPSNDDVIH